jgi:hypothetical protein
MALKSMTARSASAIWHLEFGICHFYLAFPIVIIVRAEKQKNIAENSLICYFSLILTRTLMDLLSGAFLRKSTAGMKWAQAKPP